MIKLDHNINDNELLFFFLFFFLIFFLMKYY